MKLLFVADPLEAFKTYKDTTFAMMREAASRGHELLACEPADLMWQSGGRVTARSRRITLTGQAHDWFTVNATDSVALADMGAVIMRKDPPFDSEYFYATH
ncbi:MAG TPA: glutathione synthase, partial [Albitalea sp.]|nr:glutathione synthase [Albitalea sp.]